MKAFQDQIPGNFCYGCGSLNEQGLQLKSYWEAENESICRFIPSVHHAAGPLHFLNGGIIATIIDCHCVCTAIAWAYRAAGREIGGGETIWYATAALEVNYKCPVRIDREVILNAKVLETSDRKVVLNCLLYSASEETPCAEARVVAVRTPLSWLEDRMP
jgi:acyl-coenzyme A thioesterase PaaI-like protein